MHVARGESDELARTFAARLIELHGTLAPREQRILEHLFLRSLDPVTRRQVAGTPPFTDEELEFLAGLDRSEP